MRTLGTGSSQAAAGDHSHADADNFVSGVAVDSEVPTGAIDGVNADFVLAFTPIATSEHVYKNGLRQFVGASNDYTIVTDTITFVAGNLPQTGDRVIVDYRK